MKTFPISSNCQLGLCSSLPSLCWAAGLWSPCGHTYECPCVCMCANFSYMCTRCVLLGELLCPALAHAPVHSGVGAGKISCSSGSLIRIK